MTKSLNINDNDFENFLRKSLKSNGYLFPTTDDEVDNFESSNDIEKAPDKFNNMSELLKKGRIERVKPIVQNTSGKTIDNLAMAARKGEGISKEILEQMKKDRDESEYKQ